MSVQVSTLITDSHKVEVHVKNQEDSVGTWSLVISDTPGDRMFPEAEYRFWLSRSQLEQIVQTIEEALKNE